LRERAALRIQAWALSLDIRTCVRFFERNQFFANRAAPNVCYRLLALLALLDVVSGVKGGMLIAL